MTTGPPWSFMTLLYPYSTCAGAIGGAPCLLQLSESHLHFGFSLSLCGIWMYKRFCLLKIISLHRKKIYSIASQSVFSHPQCTWKVKDFVTDLSKYYPAEEMYIFLSVLNMLHFRDGVCSVCVSLLFLLSFCVIENVMDWSTLCSLTFTLSNMVVLYTVWCL